MGEGNWEEAELGELPRERLSDLSTEKGREGEQSQYREQNVQKCGG